MCAASQLSRDWPRPPPEPPAACVLPHQHPIQASEGPLCEAGRQGEVPTVRLGARGVPTVRLGTRGVPTVRLGARGVPTVRLGAKGVPTVRLGTSRGPHSEAGHQQASPQ